MLNFIARNLHPRRLFNPAYRKRLLHMATAWAFRSALKLTKSPVEFRFSPDPVINVAGILLEYDIANSGDVQGMDVDGPWEPKDTAYILDKLRDGGVFYDIGANIGWCSLNVALKTPATVFAFEPQAQRLRRNIALNHASIVILETALGEHAGFATMTTDNKSANRISFNGEGRLFSVYRLDELVENDNLPGPTVIKIDIEGFEYFALKGGIETLRKYHPVILCEITELGEQYPDGGRKRLMELFENLGYHLIDAGLSNCVFEFMEVGDVIHHGPHLRVTK